MKVDTKGVKIKELDTGDVIIFSYDDGLKVARVLNPEWEGKLHALKLPDNFTNVDLFSSDSDIVKAMKKDVLSRTKASELIRRYGDPMLERSYRTYSIKKIKNLQKVLILRGDNEVDEEGLTYDEKKKVILALTNLVNTLRAVYNKTKSKS